MKAIPYNSFDQLPMTDRFCSLPTTFGQFHLVQCFSVSTFLEPITTYQMSHLSMYTVHETQSYVLYAGPQANGILANSI